MRRLQTNHIANRWAECPPGGYITGVYICPGAVPGADPLVSHGWDQGALAFHPWALNRLGDRIYSWHLQTDFWDDCMEKGRVVRARVRRYVERRWRDHDELGVGPVRATKEAVPFRLAWPLERNFNWPGGRGGLDKDYDGLAGAG
jgi:hypothetical protein